MKRPYAITLDASVSMDLTEDFRPFSETFRAVLSRLDGMDSFAVSLWQTSTLLPETAILGLLLFSVQALPRLGILETCLRAPTSIT